VSHIVSARLCATTAAAENTKPNAPLETDAKDFPIEDAELGTQVNTDNNDTIAGKGQQVLMVHENPKNRQRTIP
jgi:hypothetical protein